VIASLGLFGGTQPSPAQRWQYVRSGPWIEFATTSRNNGSHFRYCEITFCICHVCCQNPVIEWKSRLTSAREVWVWLCTPSATRMQGEDDGVSVLSPEKSRGGRRGSEGPAGTADRSWPSLSHCPVAGVGVRRELSPGRRLALKLPPRLGNHQHHGCP